MVTFGLFPSGGQVERVHLVLRPEDALPARPVAGHGAHLRPQQDLDRWRPLLHHRWVFTGQTQGGAASPFFLPFYFSSMLFAPSGHVHFVCYLLMSSKIDCLHCTLSSSFHAKRNESSLRSGSASVCNYHLIDFTAIVVAAKPVMKQGKMPLIQTSYFLLLLVRNRSIQLKSIRGLYTEAFP